MSATGPVQTVLAPDRSSVRLEFASRAALEAYLERTAGQGFTARLAERLEPGAELDLVLAAGPEERSFRCRIKQVFRSGRDLYGHLLATLPGEADDEATTASDATPVSGEAVVADDDDPQAAASETSGTSVAFDVRQLPVSERIRLASKATRQERQILLRDTAPPVIMALLSNPRIELKEVQEIVRNPQLAAGIIQRIAQDRRFIGNYEIQLSLVKNPKTPSPVAIRLVEHLRRGDLRDLAKSQALRENIRSAVLRTYLKRSS